MKMTITGCAHNRVLHVYTDTDFEYENLIDFAHPGEPLTATIKKGPGHEWGHIEIKKEH